MHFMTYVSKPKENYLLGVKDAGQQGRQGSDHCG